MQDYPREDVGIIISYLCSEEEHLGELAALCREHEATLVVAQADVAGGFKTPLARNMGLRRVARPAVAFVDGDVCLHPATFKAAAATVAAGGGVILPVADMPIWPNHRVFRQCDDPAELAAVAEQDGQRREAAMGAIIVPTAAAVAVRGYDERMAGWGADDTDFVERVKRHGTVMGSPQVPFAMHQKHDFAGRNAAHTARNRRHFFAAEPARNPAGWGGVPG
jgi:hypothetical protein